MALVPTISSVIPNNWNSVVSANIDTQRAIQKLTTLLGPQSAPAFSGLSVGSFTVGSLSGILRATNGIISGNAMVYDIDFRAILVNL